MLYRLVHSHGSTCESNRPIWHIRAINAPSLFHLAERYLPSSFLYARRFGPVQAQSYQYQVSYWKPSSLFIHSLPSQLPPHTTIHQDQVSRGVAATLPRCHSHQVSYSRPSSSFIRSLSSQLPPHTTIHRGQVSGGVAVTLPRCHSD